MALAKKTAYLLLIFILLWSTACKVKLSSSTLTESTSMYSFEGLSLRYTIQGSGPPVLVVFHGEIFFRMLPQALQESLTWVLIDFLSPEASSPKELSLETISSALYETQKALGLEKSLCLGHSLPGILALDYALRYPQKCSGLILIAVPPSVTQQYYEARQSYWSQNATPERKMLLDQSLTQLLTDLQEEPLSSFDKYRIYAPIYWFEPSFIPEELFINLPADEFLDEQLVDQALSGYDPGEKLEDLSIPVFLALGRYDFSVPIPLWETSASMIQDIEMVIFEQSGHFPMLEEAEAFVNSLNRWLKANFKLASHQ